MDNIVDITLENFQPIILEASQQKLVMVDFWADWCEPCKSLTPVLEKLAGEYANDLILAKINVDEQQQIAAQFGVRNLPTVMLVKDAQPIDGFAGLQTEQEIRAILDKHLPKPEDSLFTQAAEFIQQGDHTSAFPLAKQAHELNGERTDIKFALADCYIEMGHIEPAKALMATIGMVDQDATYQALMGKIDLAEQAADSPEIQALQAEMESDPDNLELKVKLGVQLQQANRHEEALEMLFAVLKTDVNFGEAKKLALDAINALPPGDPLAAKFRRKIYSLLY